ncbi:MAG: serine hydrolase [Candidatus Sphingomonas colombiensis]|nr:serine hydrolase domain-containing protein [Sphingomonas sp.]WEK42916.1 MAG: serine hydrolase [Sphingomonas sp.]
MRTWALGAVALVASAAFAQGNDKQPANGPIASTAARTAATPATGPASLNKADLDVWLDGYMPYALRSGDIPGAVVTIVKDGQVLTARGFGYADVAKRTPVDPDRTLFRPGSVSKLVTWTAVMQQVEQGKLDLDADVNRYIDFKIPARNGQPVTLRQIMTHTAGFEETAKDIIFYDPAHLRPLGDFVKRSLPARIYDAGTTPAYSNWATALAAYIVERASGEEFDGYVERHIFAPLGMKTATFRQPLPQRLSAQMATGYPKPGEAAAFELVGPAPAGSLSASGTDMAKFMLAHLQGGELGGNRILNAQTAAMMHNSPLDRVNPYSLIPPLNRMELGFFETNVNGHQVIGHLGDTAAFHTSLHLFMNDGVGLYVSFNGPGRQGAVGALRTALFEDFADRYFPAKPSETRVDAQTARQHAQMMTGLWRNSRRSETNFISVMGLLSQAEVSVDAKGNLVIPALKMPGGRAREWVEISPFVWRDRYGHDRVAATVIDGKVVRWSMDGISPFMVFDRVPAGIAGSWLKPALYLSLAILAFAFLAWPISWAIRRRYRATIAISGRALKAHRATRIMAGLVLGVLIGWMALVSAMFSNLKNLAGAFDTFLLLLQGASAIVFVGAVGISSWNLWETLRGDRKWTAKLGSLLIFFASLLVLYFAISFHLMSISTKY